MSRELKFRVYWDEVEGVGPAHSLFYYEGEQYVSWDNGACEGLVSEIPVMQYTGLRDHNGVEIYEGDILQWDGSIVGVVSFAHCEFIVGEGVNARALCAVPSDAGVAEIELIVVGNRFENPELLEGAKAHHTPEVKP